ncbi:MAG: S8 family serine peptidase, partial [Promethearchaeota archaeon]
MKKTNSLTKSIILMSLILSSMFLPIISQTNSHEDVQNLDNNNYTSQLSETDSIVASNADYDNKTYRYIFLYPSLLSLQDNSTLFGDFSSFGGILEAGPWEEVYGFAGRINNSLLHLGAFLAPYPELSYEKDAVIEAQMNTVHDQLNLYPELYSLDNNSILGTSNATIAIVDSGIDLSHPIFNNSYEELNFSQQIVAWEDFVSEIDIPYDDNGHGTVMSSIIGGSHDILLSSNHTSDSYYLSAALSINHQEYFYPHYLSANWYDIKIASFSMDENALDLLMSNTNLTILSPMLEYELQLYRDGEIINSTSGSDLELSWDTSDILDSNLKPGNYDLVFSYKKTLIQNPIFNLQSNISFTPTSYSRNIAEFSGVAPEARLTSLKVLNNSGIGYISDLISSFEYILSNISSLHIITVLISVASFDLGETMIEIFNSLSEKVFQEGCMIILSAGNQGVANKINNLAINSKTIVVGAINDLDQLTYYSSQGEEGEDQRFPDILAPGGSLLLNHEMIITPDANIIDNQGNLDDIIQDDLTVSTGTSISASIVAGIYNLIIDFMGGWDHWLSSPDRPAIALAIKNYLLLTASETNILREDNPYTPLDESVSSPLLNRGDKDRYEGYGRINPEAIISMLNNSLELNKSYQINLVSSETDAMASHVFGINVSLEKDQLYEFNLNNEAGFFSDFDMDLYLYDKLGDINGNPILLEYSTQEGNSDEHFYFTNLNQTDTFYVVIKAIAGEGACSLNISKKAFANYSQISDDSFSTLSGMDFNDTLDTYRFEINYTQAEDIPATFVRLTFPDLALNYSLEQNDEIENTYDDGCIYFVEVNFTFPGNFSYYFVSQTGNLTTYYLKDSPAHLIINPIHHYAGLNFTLGESIDVDLWDMENTDNNLLFYGEKLNITSGWGNTVVNNSFEDRAPFGNEDAWETFYCGNFLSESNTNTIMVHDNSLIYNYYNLSGEYSLYSPIVFLLDQSGENFSSLLNMGLRLSLNQGDFLAVEINSNRSGWELLENFTNTEQDWTPLTYNLSEYNNNYIQIRLRGNFQSSNYIYQQGILLDHFQISSEFEQANYNPILSNPIINLDVTQPFYQSSMNTEFDLFEFSVGYWEEFGRLPEEVLLEINNQNFTMVNKYGIWQTGEYLNSSDNEIIYSAQIYIWDLSNTSFRFHSLLGNGTATSSPFYQMEPLDTPSPLSFPFTEQLDLNEYLLTGFPNNSSQSDWIQPNEGWQQVNNYENYTGGPEFYCGIGELQGYGQDYSSSLITPLINLNGTNEVFIYLEHRLRFDSDGNDGDDYAEIFISSDLGETWESLLLLSEETEGLEFSSIAIDITDFIGQDINLQFYFSSDDSGELIQRSGWQIKSFSLDINYTKDYDSPEVIFHDLNEGDTISGIFNLTIYIYDDSAIDVDRTEFWVDNKPIDFTLINNSIISSIDTWKLPNKEAIEVIIVVYDVEGNRRFEKITLYIDNPLSNQDWIFLLGGSIALFSILLYSTLNQLKIRKLKASGDYIR